VNNDTKYMIVNTFHPYYNSLYQDVFAMIEDSSQPYIPIVVDSPGGYTWNLSVLLDCIDDATKPVITIGSGIQMSCGAVLLTSGTQGLRIVSPNSTVMVHQAASMTWGKSSDMISDSADVHKTTQKFVYERFDKNAGKESGFTEELVRQNMNADLFLDAQQTVDYGFADVIMSRNKALSNLDQLYFDYCKKKEEI
jgi:ATP-dependent Clp protease protease subunit